jgi:2-haloalkanoic acid dehalogenase type II
MPRPLTDFTTLTFDCYGTLIDWETGIWQAVSPWLAAHGRDIPREDVLAAFGAKELRHETATPGALYPDILAAVHADMAAGWGLPADAAAAQAFGASVPAWPAFPDSAQALAYLKQHYKLVIISNIDRESFRHSNEKLGVDFDLTVTAQDVGSYKPNLANFHYAFDKLAAMGVAQEQVLHVAESLHHDHVPAKQLGLTSVWIHRRHGKAGTGATATPGEAVTPDYEFPSMADFVAAHRAAI